jgi:hypothetical protein
MNDRADALAVAARTLDLRRVETTDAYRQYAGVLDGAALVLESRSLGEEEPDEVRLRRALGGTGDRRLRVHKRRRPEPASVDPFLAAFAVDTTDAAWALELLTPELRADLAEVLVDPEVVFRVTPQEAAFVVPTVGIDVLWWQSPVTRFLQPARLVRACEALVPRVASSEYTSGR